VDGLCSGTAGLALAGICAFALLGGMPPVIALPLCIAALAFLRQNLSRQRAFLGDSGSMLLGFMIAALALRAVVTPEGALAALPLLMLLSLPVTDITVTFFRRALQGRNPLQADRGHIHHILLLMVGGKARRASAILLAMAFAGAAGGLLAGLHPPLALALIGVPLGFYLAVYSSGGYLSWRNLRNAGAATGLATTLAEYARRHGTAPALDREELIRLLECTGVTSVELFDDRGRRVWSVGLTDQCRDTLIMPLYAAGRVRCGQLRLQGPGSAGSMAFAAHLLQPLYSTFMDALDVESPVIPATVKVHA
jgi:hypothetical protein